MAENPNGPSADQEQGRALVISVIIVALIMFAFTKMQEEFSAFSGSFAYLHLYPLAKLVELVPWLRGAPVIGPAFLAKVELAKLWLDQGNFAYMTPEQRRHVLTYAGYCASPIYLPFMVWAGFKGRSFRPDMVFKTPYTLDHMIWTQSEHWTTSRVARHLNPLKKPEVSAGFLARAITKRIDGDLAKLPEHGALVSPVPAPVMPAPWHRSLRPEEWLVANGLCLDEKHIRKAKEIDWEYPDKLLESRSKWQNLSIETLKEVLAEQLRTPWTGFDDLRPCHKALASVMASFYDYDIDGGNALLSDFALIADGIKNKPGGMDQAILAEDGMMGKIEKILGGKAGKKLLGIANQHAWVESAFPAMLAISRKDRGVLPAAAFLWLKSEDRPMWYILDSVGSEAIMIEAAGAMSHYRAEHQIGKPIRRPAVYQASRATLEDYLDMTEERIAARAIKEERGRSAGQQIDLLLGGDD